MKILIVEDELDLLNSLKTYLTSEGFICDTATAYQAGSELISTYAYDCALFDITMPGGSGITLVKEMKKQNPETGIIIISARNSVDDKVTGLEVGADDYVTKPFHLSELNARLKALIRRRNFSGAEIVKVNDHLRIDLTAGEVFVKEKLLQLTQKEYELLLYFVSGKGKVLTKEAIAEHLWGSGIDQADSFGFIYTHIKNLRKKIEEAGGDDPIQTVYGLGYKFTTH